MRTYAIGDIHGHLDKLQALHGLIAADRAAYGIEDT
ncbi:MAG: serine/threonine protein phosphatase, partial [Albidovulum sp.]